MTVELKVKQRLADALRIDRPRDNSYIHASSVGDCRRKQGYMLTGVEPLPHTDNLLHVFDVGTAIHKHLQERLVAMGWVRPENIELRLGSETLRVGGTCDALSEPLSFLGDKRFIIDIKTITGKPRVHYDPDGNLWAVDKSSYDHLDKPKPNHLMQVNLYSWLWRSNTVRAYLEDFPGLMLIYVAKDTGHEHEELPYKIFVSEFDPTLLEETLKRAAYIHSKIEKGAQPAKDFYFSPKNRCWQCSSCEYRNTCLPQYFNEQGECLL